MSVRWRLVGNQGIECAPTEFVWCTHAICDDSLVHVTGSQTMFCRNSTRLAFSDCCNLIPHHHYFTWTRYGPVTSYGGRVLCKHWLKRRFVVRRYQVHCLNQCWLTIRSVLWYSLERKYRKTAHQLNPWHELSDCIWKSITPYPRGQSVKFRNGLSGTSMIMISEHVVI